MTERRCVIVAGFPRSGTSWLAKSLSFAREFTYYREPDNSDWVPEAEERFRWLYLTGEHDDPAYRRLMTRALAGRVATTFTMREDPGPLIATLGRGRRLAERFPVLFMRKRDVLVKLVNANLNLAWFSANFPRARQVFVLRIRAASSRVGSASGGNPRLTGCCRTLAWWPTISSPTSTYRRRSQLLGARRRCGPPPSTSCIARPGVTAADSSWPTSGSAGSAAALPGPVPPARHGLDPGGGAIHPLLRHRCRSSDLLVAPPDGGADRQMEARAQPLRHRGMSPLRGALRPPLLPELRAPGGDPQR